MIIKTSEDKWFEKTLKAYTDKREFSIIDDNNIGLTDKDLKSAINLITFLRKQKSISWRQLTQSLAGVGITSIGVWMVAAAIADPEPTSKLTLLIAGGIVLALTGSLGILAALGLKFSVSAKGVINEFTIKPEN